MRMFIWVINIKMIDRVDPMHRHYGLKKFLFFLLFMFITAFISRLFEFIVWFLSLIIEMFPTVIYFGELNLTTTTKLKKNSAGCSSSLMSSPPLIKGKYLTYS